MTGMVVMGKQSRKQANSIFLAILSIDLKYVSSHLECGFSTRIKTLTVGFLHWSEVLKYLVNADQVNTVNGAYGGIQLIPKQAVQGVLALEIGL